MFTCGRGGTGRRATLRSLWPKGRGSSSLLDRTITSLNGQGAFGKSGGTRAERIFRCFSPSFFATRCAIPAGAALRLRPMPRAGLAFPQGGLPRPSALVPARGRFTSSAACARQGRGAPVARGECKGRFSAPKQNYLPPKSLLY